MREATGAGCRGEVTQTVHIASTQRNVLIEPDQSCPRARSYVFLLGGQGASENYPHPKIQKSGAMSKD